MCHAPVNHAQHSHKNGRMTNHQPFIQCSSVMFLNVWVIDIRGHVQMFTVQFTIQHLLMESTYIRWTLVGLETIVADSSSLCVCGWESETDKSYEHTKCWSLKLRFEGKHTEHTYRNNENLLTSSPSLFPYCVGVPLQRNDTTNVALYFLLMEMKWSFSFGCGPTLMRV